jgi:hypothetical protein
MPDIADEHTFLVLNAAHLKKLASAEEIAHACGVGAETAGTVLASAAETGLALNMDGRYMLMPEGTEAVLSYYRRAYETARADPDANAWYDRFEAINAQFIKQVSDWQTSGGEERAQSRVLKTVERLIRNLEDLTATIPRYETYVRRFEHSMALVDRGDTDYVCKPTIDSVHNIWFEFHEDILNVLGRTRDA